MLLKFVGNYKFTKSKQKYAFLSNYATFYTKKVFVKYVFVVFCLF